MSAGTPLEERERRTGMSAGPNLDGKAIGRKRSEGRARREGKKEGPKHQNVGRSPPGRKGEGRKEEGRKGVHNGRNNQPDH
jgi:hypothetical protein